MKKTKAPVPVSSLPPVEYRGQRVITLAQMDAVHGRPEGTARRNFNANKKAAPGRLVEGRHYAKLSADEFRSRFPGVVPERTTEDVTLLTERGYLVLVKSFTDDLAWQVQEQLVDGYFRAKAPQQAIDLSDPIQLRAVATQLLELNAKKDEQIAVLAPKAAALDRLAGSNGAVSITMAAKLEGIPPGEMFKRMNLAGMIYKRPGSKYWMAYDKFLKAGLLDQKFFILDEGGPNERHIPQVLVTHAGLAWIARKLAKAQPNLREPSIKAPAADASLTGQLNLGLGSSTKH